MHDGIVHAALAEIQQQLKDLRALVESLRDRLKDTQAPKK
jgi:hypothetical protein